MNVLLIIVAGCLVTGFIAVCLVRYLAGYEARSAQIKRRAREADRRVDSEYRRARRAMNDAAGKGWKNLTG